MKKKHHKSMLPIHVHRFGLLLQEKIAQSGHTCVFVHIETKLVVVVVNTQKRFVALS